MAFLALLHRLQFHIFPNASSRAARHARRVYTYSTDMHWQGLNALASSGVVFMTAGLLVFLVERLPERASWKTRREQSVGRRRAGMVDVLSAAALQLSSYSNRERRDPLWEDPPNQPVVVGMRDDIRQTLVTHSLDADPQHKDEDPGPSIWPFLSAVTVFSAAFVGSIFTPWAVPIQDPARLPP